MIFGNKEVQQKVDENIEKEAKIQRKELSFIKLDNNWYAKVPGVWDTPMWQSTVMVSTFPAFLDALHIHKWGVLPEENDELTVEISNIWFTGCNIFLLKERIEENSYEGEGQGGYYTIYMIQNNSFFVPIPHSWLCPVNTVVWEGNHPDEIFAKVI